MKKEQKTQRKSYKKLSLFVAIMLGMYLTLTAYLIYNLYKLTGVETTIRYVVIGILIIFSLFILTRYIKILYNPNLRKYTLFIFVLLLFGSAEYFIGYTISKGLNVVDSISKKEYRNYSTSLVVLKNGSIKTKDDISYDSKIGRVNDENDVEGYVLTKNIMDKNSITDKQIANYEDPITMLYDLYDGKIDGAFISSGYVATYSKIEKFQNIDTDLLQIDSYKKKMKVQKDKSTTATTKSPTEPFTMLLMGVDSDEEDLSGLALGDSLMLVTFNPTTLNATMLSIPRDTYIPITCYGNRLSKITHAASGGDSCMISTIEKTFEVDIDYYAKVNFRGLMKLVDALGGIDVDVPYAFCETTMWRTEDQMVYVKAGRQHLDGGQALALSRNRKTYPSCGPEWNEGTRNDFVRGQNQQLVIKAIINKAKTMTSISQFYAVLDAVGNSMTTNMDRNQILSFYNVFKNVVINSKDLTAGNDIITMQKMYLNGSDGIIYDNIMNMNLYEYVPSNESLNAIIEAMKINLELIEDTPNKNFSFSADEDYEPETIGKNLYGGIPHYSAKEDEKPKEKTCGKNEELGADKVTCVCKHGYEKNEKTGKCEELKKCTGLNEQAEPSSDGTCECMVGYERNEEGECVESSEDGGDDPIIPVDPDNPIPGPGEDTGDDKPTEGDGDDQTQEPTD